MVAKPAAAEAAKLDLFAREYIVDFNATQAALRAGLGKTLRTTRQRGYEMMQREDVQQRIRELVEARKQRIEVTEEALVEEARRLAFASAGDIVKWGPQGIEIRCSTELTPEEMATVAEVSETKTEHGGTIKVKQHDKIGPLRLLMQYKGMLRDKVEHTGAGGAPLVFELIGMDAPAPAEGKPAPKRARTRPRPEDVEEI